LAEKLKPEEVTDLIRFIRHEFQGRDDAAGKPMKGYEDEVSSSPCLLFAVSFLS